MSKRIKSKPAKGIRAGDWCVFGASTWLAGRPYTNDAGKIVIPWGNGSEDEFHPEERIKIQARD